MHQHLIKNWCSSSLMKPRVLVRPSSINLSVVEARIKHQKTFSPSLGDLSIPECDIYVIVRLSPPAAATGASDAHKCLQICLLQFPTIEMSPLGPRPVPFLLPSTCKEKDILIRVQKSRVGTGCLMILKHKTSNFRSSFISAIWNSCASLFCALEEGLDTGPRVFVLYMALRCYDSSEAWLFYGRN